MVAAFDYCLHGKGGAAPSIDTAMHGLVDAAHVDHLHPDSGIAIATVEGRREADRRRSSATRSCGCRGVAPASSSASTSPRSRRRTRRRSAASSAATASPRGATRPRRPRRTRSGSSRPPQAYIDANGKKDPFGKARAKFAALPEAERRAKAAALAATIRGLASHDKPMVGHFTDDPRVLEFLASAKAPEARRARHELPRPLPAHQGQADAARPARRTRPSRSRSRGCKELHEAYRADYTGVLRRSTRRPSPPRSAAPTRSSCSCPGVGMFSYGANKQTARVAGEFYLNAINVMRGAEALSTYSPISDAEKFRIEYWALEEAKLQRMPKPKTHQGRIAFVTGAASGIGKAIATRLAAEGACVVIADLDLEKAQAAAAELGGTDVAIGVAANVADADGVQAAIDATRARVRRHRPRREQRRPVAVEAAARDHREGLGPAARRHGEGLVPRVEGRREGAHRAGARRRHHLHLVEELRLRRPEQHRLLGDEGRPGPPGAPARGRARRVRRARSTASTPTASCAAPASSPPAGARTAPRPTASKEEDLGKFYAQRTILKREVVPENVANAVIRAHRPRAHAARRACTSRSTPASPPPSCDDRRGAAREHASAPIHRALATSSGAA